MSVSREALKEIQSFLLKGEKINAIRYLKETYGFSLEESRILVESVEGKIRPAETSFTDKAVLDENARDHVAQLLGQGKKIQAIKWVKTSTGANLKAAKTLVEQVEKQLGRAGAPARTGLTGLRIALGFFGLAGAAFLLVAGWLYMRQADSIASSQVVKGKVVRLVSQTGERASAPVIEYEWNDRKWLHVSSIYTSPPAYRVDEEVSLFVNREDPSSVYIDSFTDRWAAILIFCVLGAVFILLSTVLGYVLRK